MTPSGTWSPSLKVGNEIVLSGVTARGKDGTEGGASMKGQTLAVLARIAAKDEVNKARAAFFKGAFPCSTLVEVKGLVFPDLLVESDAVANLTVDRHEEYRHVGH